MTNQYSDVTMQCDGQKFFWHKIILTAQSKFFSSLFSDVFGGGDKSSHPIFHLPGVAKTGLEKAINYIYCRPMHLTMPSIWVVIKDVALLLLEEVADKCSKFFLNNLETSNCLSVLDMADKFHLARLSVQVEDFILHNLWQRGGTEEFLGMESSRLVSSYKMTGWWSRWRRTSVMSWIEGSKDRRGEVEKIVQVIWFCMMDRTGFLQNIASDPSTISSPL
jgi:hypothetical protein